jgi:hypothetical protein
MLNEQSNNTVTLGTLRKDLGDTKIELRKQDAPDLAGLTKYIGISLSKQCVTMITNNYTTNCPDYRVLHQVDSSIASVSGGFVDEPYYHREPPIMQQSWRYYDYDNTPRIFVDPSADMSTRMKTITLLSNFDTYMLSEKSISQQYEIVPINVTSAFGNTTRTILIKNQTADYQRIIYHDRYVDATCKHATINADKWQTLLADTISYLRNNCDEKHTSFVSVELIPANFTEQDISTSQKYTDEVRLKYIKEFCIFKYKACTT